MAEQVRVKTERPDEAEINELAAKMKEANKAKALAASMAAARPPNPMAVNLPPGPGGQMGILNFLHRKATPESTTPKTVESEKKVPAPDEASYKGHFGWDMLGKCHIPYIFRSGEKYVAVRMVEIKLLNKYLNYLHQDIYSCTCIRSYYITEIEARLLNEINTRHCDGQFGRENFTQKDLVVRLSDANEFYNFLDVCYNKLLRGTTNSKDKCGFIRINKESVVPYTVRDGQKYVPLFYFEGETDNLKLKADQLKGWDLSYLKFCCKVQGIRNELFASETCSVISLTDIKSYFPPGTEFEEYWPNKVVDSQLLISAKGTMSSSSGGGWTRQPAAPPPGAAVPAASAPPPPRGRGRPNTHQPRHNPQPMQNALGHSGLSAAAVHALANGWNIGAAAGLSQVQTQQVLRFAQVQAQAQIAAQAQVANRFANNNRNQRTIPFNNQAMSMSMAAQQAPPPLVRSSANTSSLNSVTQSVSASMNGHSNMHATSAKRLIPIPEVPTSGSHTPYKVQKALVENTMVPCINMKPYLYGELLMTLPDLASQFFPRIPLPTCRAMLDALGITLYRPNATQLQILRNSGKCKSAAAGDNGMALVEIRDVISHMPQFKYMLRGQTGDETHAHNPHPAHAPPAKRARAS